MFIIFFVFTFLLVVSYWSIWTIGSQANDINKKLNDLKERSKLASTKEELKSLWMELKEVNKECWHKSFSTKVVEIKTIIETKYDLI
jgi:hypothetical protein